jgi:hypothetical protein
MFGMAEVGVACGADTNARLSVVFSCQLLVLGPNRKVRYRFGLFPKLILANLRSKQRVFWGVLQSRPLQKVAPTKAIVKDRQLPAAAEDLSKGA